MKAQFSRYFSVFTVSILETLSTRVYTLKLFYFQNFNFGNRLSTRWNWEIYLLYILYFFEELKENLHTSLLAQAFLQILEISRIYYTPKTQVLHPCTNRFTYTYYNWTCRYFFQKNLWDFEVCGKTYLEVIMFYGCEKFTLRKCTDAVSIPPIFSTSLSSFKSFGFKASNHLLRQRSVALLLWFFW